MPRETQWGQWFLAAVCAVLMGSAAATVDRIAEAEAIWGTAIVGFLQVAPAVCGQLFNISPIPTMSGVMASQSTGNLPILPYAMMISNGYLWMVYGTLRSDSTLIYANVSGLILGLVYVLMFLRYKAPGTEVSQPLIISGALCTVVTVLSYLHGAEAADSIGQIGCFVVVVMFSGPLSVIRTVIAEHSTASLPFPMAVATFFNCILWTAYGCIIHDVYVYGPNILGLASAVVQLALFGMYGFGKPHRTLSPTKTF